MSYSVWKLDFDLLNFRNTVVQHRFAILLTDAKTEITQSTPPNATGPIPSGACCLTRSSMSAKPTNNASNALSSPPFGIGGSLLGRVFSLRSGLIAQQAHQHLHPLQHQWACLWAQFPPASSERDTFAKSAETVRGPWTTWISSKPSPTAAKLLQTWITIWAANRTHKCGNILGCCRRSSLDSQKQSKIWTLHAAEHQPVWFQSYGFGALLALLELLSRCT